MALRDRIEAIMKASDRSPDGWLERILLAISKVYGLGVQLRSLAYDQGIFKVERLPCVVISIGNVTLGGTGKTPFTIYVAKTLQNLGYRIAILSRGYGGTAVKSAAIVSDGSQTFVSADACGDEPFMMAHQINGTPIIAGADRYRSGKLAVRRFKPDIILLDDGFQHRHLARDIDLVLVDALKPWGNEYLFPRGVLREPPTSINRGHAVVLTRIQSDGRVMGRRLNSLPDSIPVFASQHRSKIVKVIPANKGSVSNPVHGEPSRDLRFLNARRAVAFSGIAANENFFGALRKAGCRLVHSVPFPDHHRYSRSDIDRVRQCAADSRVDYVLTTEKDYYRMSGTIDWGFTLLVVGVEIEFQDEAFNDYLAGQMKALLKPQGATRTCHNGSK